MRWSIQPRAAAKGKRRAYGRWWLLSAVVLGVLVLAGSAYATITNYYFSTDADPGKGGGDNTLYYRNFNNSCSYEETGKTKSIYADSNGTWIASIVKTDECGISMAHLAPSTDYGYTYVESKCRNADTTLKYLVCWTTRPSSAPTTEPSGASVGSALAGGNSSGTPPVAAFTSAAVPAASDQAAVGSLASDVGHWPAGITNHQGAPLIGQARDLIRDVGTADDTVAAFPTTTGEVCYEVRGSGSCGFVDKRGFYDAGITFSILWDRASGATRIFGVAANQVKSVTVEIGGVEHPAILQNNGFYYELPDGVSDNQVQQLFATWKDGSVHSFPVGR